MKSEYPIYHNGVISETNVSGGPYQMPYITNVLKYDRVEFHKKGSYAC